MSISKKILYVGNLPRSIKNEDLTAMFEEFGPLVAHYTEMTDKGYDKSFGTFVVTNYQDGRSRGFGFVEFDGDDAEENAAKAIEALNGQLIRERPITVRYQEERPPVERGERRPYPGNADNSHSKSPESAHTDEE